MNSEIAARFKRNAKVMNSLVHPRSLPLGLAETQIPSLVLDQDGAVVDVAFNGRRYYGEDARRYCQRQAQAFYDSNIQLERDYIAFIKDDELFYQFARDVDADADQPLMLEPQLCGFGENYASPKDYCASLVIFGLGLGYHIPQLIRLYRPLRVIIFDAIHPFWAASAAALDWETIRDRCRRDSVELILFFHTDLQFAPGMLIDATKSGSGAMSCFGRYFVHYNEPPVRAVVEGYASFVHQLSAGEGYFVDEMRQSVQTAGNLLSNRIISKPPSRVPLAKSCAIIVGSGPSLDKSWEIIRRYRDKAHLISCGTAINALFKENVRPDLHVEIETHPLVANIFERMSLRGNVDGVTLLCSSGLPPDALEFFPSKILFFRDLSSTAALSEGLFPRVAWSYGRVGAAGAALAAFLGFETVLMIGMDYGYAADSPDHAGGTIYEGDSGSIIMGEVYAGAETLSRDAQQRFASERSLALIKVPGVTGAEIMVDHSFLSAISATAQLAAARPDIRIFQISEGAAISHARNVTPDDFTRQTIDVERSGEIDAYIEDCAARPDLALSFAGRMRRQLRDLEQLCADMKSYYSRPFSNVREFARIDRDAIRRLDSHWIEKSRPAADLIRGTLKSLGKASIQRAMMHPDEGGRQRYLLVARKHILVSLDRAVERLKNGYQDIFDRLPAAKK